MLLYLLLSLIGVIAILAEFFIPAAGLIGLSGLGTIIAAVVMVFREFGNLNGFLFLGGNAVIVPAIIIIYWRRFPDSFMGRRLILSESPGVARTDGDAAGVAPGSEGIALTPLRPAGTGEFGEKRLSVVTEGEFLQKGSPLRVLRVEGNRIIVERIEEGETR